MSNEPIITSSDHSYKYGDGFFETMKIVDGKILYEESHFERLFFGLKLLKFDRPTFFTGKKISDEVIELCKKNNLESSARVRLSVSRGSGGLYDHDNKMTYLIECSPLEQKKYLNKNGLMINIFPDARKTTDIFSNLKSANYLPYMMAAAWAKENKLDDALILNHHERICDATIANIFWVENGNIFTPPLSEGCISGVMRKQILQNQRLNVGQKPLTEDILLNADEVFLTNVITGIQWVRQCRNKNYQNTLTKKIFDE